MKTNTGLLTNFYSFVPFSYKLGLACTLVDRAFKINNTWTGFHLDISNLVKSLRRNLFHSNVIKNVVRTFLNSNVTSHSSQSVAQKDNCLYLNYRKLILFQITMQYRIRKLVSTFCSDTIMLVFNPFKIRSWIWAKDPIPVGLQSPAIYKVSCSGSYSANTHFTTHIHEHLYSDKHYQRFRKLVLPLFRRLF